jgi:NAD(P)H dehydrogenase (quinone)
MSEVAVTGASGKTGLSVLKALRGRGIAARALIRRSDAADVVHAHGATDVRVVDLADRDATAAALSSCRALYHIPPNMHPAEDELSGAVVAAAQLSGLSRFVLHSVLMPYVEAMPHHLRKARAEDAVRRSGLAWTILQPASYMQNLWPLLERANPAGGVSVPYSVRALFTPVDLADVAEVAAIVIADDRHDRATYELAGPELLDMVAMLSVVSTALNTPFHARTQDLASWRRAAKATGTAEQVISDLAAMFAYYDAHGFAGNPGVLRMVLGREPTDLRGAIMRDMAGR